MQTSNSEFLRNRDISTNEIIKFWRSYGFWDVPYEELCRIIEQHKKYNTLETIVFNGELIAFSRYNIVGDTVEVFETVVHPKWRHKNLIRLMLINGFKKWKWVKKIRYIRSMREKRERVYDVYKFIGVQRVKC